jgi:hypothetical protein
MAAALCLTCGECIWQRSVQFFHGLSHPSLSPLILLVGDMGKVVLFSVVCELIGGLRLFAGTGITEATGRLQAVIAADKGQLSGCRLCDKTNH